MLVNGNLNHARHRPGRAILRPGILIGTALAVTAIAATGCGTGSGSSTETTNPSAVAITPAGLRALGVSLQQPIYWVGPSKGTHFEKSSTGDGRILVRYLPASAEIGTSTPYLTVGTYTVPNAYAAAQRAASKPGAVRINVATSAIAFSTKAHPLNAWIAYPGSRFQIEVFDPKPGRARSLVASGKVARMPGTPIESRPVVVSAKSLAKVATAAQRPIYWAGPQPQLTYELTKTRQGSFLLRYLRARSRPRCAGAVAHGRHLSRDERARRGQAAEPRKGREGDETHRRRPRGRQPSLPEERVPRLSGIEL